MRHLNKLRWFCLSSVFIMLLVLPALHVYQNYAASHAYDLLTPSEKTFYDVMEYFTAPFVTDPSKDLDAIKGTTWSGSFFGLRLSDPLAVVGQVAASLDFRWAFVITAVIPVLLTVLFGRFFCGWICPATFFYELVDRIALLLRRTGVLPQAREHTIFDRRFKYVVLVVGMVLSAVLGSVVMASIYPPAVIGRELYYTIAYAGVGSGTVFFLVTVLFDVLVARRGFCRYLCPGGALYSLLGRWRVLRIQRLVTVCNDCTLCNIECQFGLDPKRDGFGEECNNCTACIAVCPKDALEFRLSLTDQPPQGPGHLGAAYQRRREE